MDIGDRYNRIEATMARLDEEGLRPVLAIRNRGRIYEFRINPHSGYLEGEADLAHPRLIIDDVGSQFVEGYPSYQVNQALEAIW